MPAPLPVPLRVVPVPNVPGIAPPLRIPCSLSRAWMTCSFERARRSLVLVGSIPRLSKRPMKSKLLAGGSEEPLPKPPPPKIVPPPEKPPSPCGTSHGVRYAHRAGSRDEMLTVARIELGLRAFAVGSRDAASRCGSAAAFGFDAIQGGFDRFEDPLHVFAPRHQFREVTLLRVVDGLNLSPGFALISDDLHRQRARNGTEADI